MTQRTVLWWSRGGRDYSRDRIMRQAFVALGWQITDFCPRVSPFGDLEAVWERVPAADLVWVPCFRQRDVRAAVRWAARKRIPLIFDPLISAWDKRVFERKKYSEHNVRAKLLKYFEGSSMQRCGIVVADTQQHAEFFQQTFQLSPDQIEVIPVSAEEDLFKVQPATADRRRQTADRGRFRVLFYGSFIGLQGPQHIAAAAAAAPDVDWCFIGSGPFLEQCQQICGELSNVEFIARVPYESLPDRIAAADLLLGVFGTSQKAGRVIPNKAYQALACGRPLITRAAPTWPAVVQQSPWNQTGLRLVEPGSGPAIAAAVRDVMAAPDQQATAAMAARQTFDQYFSNAVVRQKLADLLERVIGASR